jgi:hypothetical protein
MEGPPPIADFSTVPGDGVDGYARAHLPMHPKDIRSARLRLSPRPA